MATTTQPAAPDQRPPKSWARLFDDFHERIGKPPFAPEFLSHQLAVMADGSRDLDERTLAWSRYRAWANYNEYACYGRGDPRPMTQRDCAIDLAALEAGRAIEWIDMAREHRPADLEPYDAAAIDKSCISRSFARNAAANLLRIERPRIYPVVDPGADRGGNTRPELPTPENSHLYQTFLSLPEVAHSREFEEWQVARARAAELGKVVLSRYREWRRAERKNRPAGMDIDRTKDEKVLEELEEPSTRRHHLLSAAATAAAPTPTTAPPARSKQDHRPQETTAPASPTRQTRQKSDSRPTPAEIGDVGAELDKHGAAGDDAAARLIRECRERTPDITPAEIVELIRRKAQQITRATANPIGFLLRGVPPIASGSTFGRIRQDLAAVAESRAMERRRQGARAADLAQELRSTLQDPTRKKEHEFCRQQLADLAQLYPEIEAGE